jgi:hypothetical protein
MVNIRISLMMWRSSLYIMSGCYTECHSHTRNSRRTLDHSTCADVIRGYTYTCTLIILQMYRWKCIPVGVIPFLRHAIHSSGFKESRILVRTFTGGGNC